MSKQIEYFVAPQSPWAYLGHARFAAIAKKHGAQVLLKPFDAMKVFSVSGGVPVSQRPPQRQAYRLAELQRWSSYLAASQPCQCAKATASRAWPLAGALPAHG